jgi:uncharacterized protein (DUF362 family)
MNNLVWIRMEGTMPTVGLVKGDDRFENVLKALENAGDEVAGKVKGNVIIKVNTVMRAGEGELANTQPEAIRAVLEYLKRFQPKRVWVGEASRHPMELFRQNNYLHLLDQYDFEFVDFNTLGYEDFDLLSIDNQVIHAKITRAYRECDCLISLSVPKAHSDAVITLSGKNMMGFVKEDGERGIWHIHGVEYFGGDEILDACTVTIHKNLRTLLNKVRPDIAVLDAYHSFEAGTVPQCARGDYVEPRFALAGADFVAVDTIATVLLGFNPQDVGYLVYAAQDGHGTMDLTQIQVAGTPLEEARFPLKPAPRYERLIQWREPVVPV